MSESTAHMIYEATTKQIAGLELERQAHLQQIAGLVAERDALRAELGYKQAECEKLNGLMIRFAADARKWRRAYSGEGEPTDEEVYVTPPHIADLALGSGAFLAAVVGNPPYADDHQTR